MKTLITTVVVFFAALGLQAQTIAAALEKHNKNSVPYITVQELNLDYDKYIILDARDKKEYDVSHLPGAIFIDAKEGFHDYLATNPDRGNPVVVYCSIGVRSEDAGETINNLEFSNVKNLYGGIFMWKDAGFTVVNPNNQPTEKVHVFNKEWGTYLKTGQKVY
jgi:rhodanese-related sulfurtransferase